MDENNFNNVTPDGNSYNNFNNVTPDGNGYNNYNNGGTNPPEPGKSDAVASMVLGIIGVVCFIFGYTAIISLILGVIGMIFASNSKKKGYVGGIRTAGYVLSIISIIGGCLIFVACVACVGCLGGLGVLSDPDLLTTGADYF